MKAGKWRQTELIAAGVQYSKWTASKHSYMEIQRQALKACREIVIIIIPTHPE